MMCRSTVLLETDVELAEHCDSMLRLPLQPAPQTPILYTHIPLEFTGKCRTLSYINGSINLTQLLAVF